jgi:CRP-like cAMP-binding protein
MAIPFQHLQRFPLLGPLSEEAIFRLSTCAEIRQFARREVVIAKEKPCFELGFLLEGRLQGVDYTVDGRNVGLYFVDPGDYFGELSVVDNQPAPEHLIAINKSSAVFLPAETSRKLIFENPAIAQALMVKLASRVRASAAQRTLLALPNPFQRLCVQILLLAQTGGNAHPQVDPAPTHQELAIMINSSRETVTRSFQILLLHQAIQRDGNVLSLLRPDFLSDIADGRIDPPKS